MTEQLLWLDVVIAHVLLHGDVDWPSSWVHGEQSAPGLFSTREGARAAAEMQRSERSAFHIREVPAICLRTETQVHIIADYVQSQPFAGLSFSRLSKSLKTGTSIDAVLAALSPSRGCWVEPPPRHALLRLQLDADAELTPAKGKHLNNWWSMVLAQPELGWSAEESTIDRTRLNGVRVAFQRVNATPPELEMPTRVFPSQRASDDRPRRVILQPSDAKRSAAPGANSIERHWEDELIDAVARAVKNVKQYFGFEPGT